MIRLGLLLACALRLSGAGMTLYDIRPDPKAKLVLTVEKTGLLSGKKHVFLFGEYRGSLAYEGESPERSHVELFVRAASAACQDDWVSEKDRKKIQAVALNDMLAAGQHPELHFTSTRLTRLGENSFQVDGTLTIRGTAKPASLTVAADRGSGGLRSVSGKGVVRLTDYGLKPPRAALGAVGTKNEMTVEFHLVLTPAAAADPTAARP